jgi:ABC-type metal ion transport system substrate-binding protein
MNRRTLLASTTLAGFSLGATCFGLGVGACKAPASGREPLRAGVLGGPEEEVLQFVAQSSPELGLSVVRRASATELRRALVAGELSFGSFETVQELSSAPESGKLLGAAPSLTLPYGFYSRKLRSLSELSARAHVAIPNGVLEQGRALLVLYHYGLVGFDEALGPNAKLADVKQNPRGLQLVPTPETELGPRLEADELVALPFGAAARLKLQPARNALAMEDGYSPCSQILTVRRGDEQAPWFSRVLAAYRTSAVKSFILSRFEDSVRRAW